MSYIPGKDADFDVFYQRITQYVAQKTNGTTPDWPHIPAAEKTKFTNSYALWNTAYQKTLGDHSSADTREKNRVRKDSEGIIERFVKRFLYEDPVTDYDRDEMTLPNHDTVRTPHGAPSTRPVIVQLVPLGGGRVRMYLVDETTPEKRARPKNTNGAVMGSTLTAPDQHVTDYALLSETELITRSPFVIELGPGAIGKRFTCALRWQNGHLKGAWSDIESLVVS